MKFIGASEFRVANEALLRLIIIPELEEVMYKHYSIEFLCNTKLNT